MNRVYDLIGHRSTLEVICGELRTPKERLRFRRGW